MKYFIAILLSINLFIPQTASAVRLWSSGLELQSATSAVEFDGQSGTGISINTTTYRSGAAALRVVRSGTAGTSYVFQQYGGSAGVDNNFVRIYVYIVTAPSANTTILELNNYNDQGTNASIYLKTDRTLQLTYYAGSGGAHQQNIGSVSSALALNTWYRIEVNYNGTNTASVNIEALLNGTSFASQTGITDAIDAGIVGRIYWGIDAGAWGGAEVATADLYFDDFAINDGTGTAQNSYAGAGSVVHMHPDSAGDAAATLGLFSAVDEVTPNDATDYVEQDTIAAFNYNFEASSVRGIGASDTITLVQIGTRQHPETAAAAAWTPQIKSQSGGTTTSGTSTTHNDTTWRTNGDVEPRNYALTSYTDPQAGGAWTPALLNTMIAGVNVTDATPNMFFSTIWALIEYIPSIITYTAPPIVFEE